MKNVDLLFFESGGFRTPKTGRVNDSFIADMGLEHIKYLKGFKNAEAYSVFTEAISHPLTDAGKIKERQDILKDFTEFPETAQKMKSICDGIRQNKCHSAEDDPKRRLLEFQSVLYKSMQTSAELAAQLKHRNLCSKSLKDLRDQLDCGEKIRRVTERIDTLVKLCVNGNIALNVEYGSAFKFRSAGIYSGITKKESKENAIFRIFQSKLPRAETNPGSFYYNENFLVAAEVEGEKGIMPLIAPYAAAVIAELNRHILAFCASLSKQLAFYIACMEIIRFMEGKNIKTVYPDFIPASGVKAKNLYDFGLLVYKTDSEHLFVANDIDACGSAVYLISGANQGGKTTFLKSVGIAQLFAQAGLKVPAEAYECPVFNNFFSHFPKDEDEDLNFGKLAEELTRIKKDIRLIADNALVLLNESFATTTETEGYEIAADLLRALSRTGSKIFFVTHNYQLLKKQHEVSKSLSGEIKSLVVSQGGTPAERTYKIIEGEPSENINAIGFFGDYFS